MIKNMKFQLNKSAMSSCNASGTTDDVTQQPTQANDKGNLRSDLLGEFGRLGPLRKELKIRGQIGETGQKVIYQPDTSDQTD